MRVLQLELEKVRGSRDFCQGVPSPTEKSDKLNVVFSHQLILQRDVQMFIPRGNKFTGGPSFSRVSYWLSLVILQGGGPDLQPPPPLDPRMVT